MTFKKLLNMLHVAIRNAVKTNARLKRMIERGNYVYVITTKDRKTGRRFIFRDGKYSSDRVLNDYDLAIVFKDGPTGFNTLALGGNTGLREAANNWDVELDGNPTLLSLFGVILTVATGVTKRD
ncbi:MAG: hypothetical protein ABSG90_14215 [Dehalococcoidia bacterium]|jgi:hypothetical protein